MSFNPKLDDLLEENVIQPIIYGEGVNPKDYFGIDKEELKQSIIQAVLDELPEKITLGDIDKGIPANYGRNDNADTQRGYNKAIDDIRKSIKGSDD